MDAEQSARALVSRWVARGWVGAAGEPGPRASELLPEGFARVRVDAPGRPLLVANQLGGFHVRCPACGAGLARGFDPYGKTRCACGGRWAWHALDCRPPIAVGWASVVLCDVGSASFSHTPEGWRAIGCRPA